MGWYLSWQVLQELSLLAWWFGEGRDLTSLGRSPEKLEEARNEMGDLGNFAPRSPRENRLFILVSITAGVCEEILYRGLLLAVLIPLVGTWPAVLLTSVVFGLGHTYQGTKGVVKTGLVGLVMALLTVFSGSLFIAKMFARQFQRHVGIERHTAVLATSKSHAIPEVNDLGHMRLHVNMI